MWPVPTLEALSLYSGRPESSYTSYAQSALLQATIIFTTITELNYAGANDAGAMLADDIILANQAILAYADWTYLKQPYQQMIANPAMSETIGGYTWSKPPPIQVRNVQAQELGIGSTGIEIWDTAIQFLSKRKRAAGVFFGQLECFERTSNTADREMSIVVRRDHKTGNLAVFGPADHDQFDIPLFGPGINAPAFPMDPGV